MYVGEGHVKILNQEAPCGERNESHDHCQHPRCRYWVATAHQGAMAVGGEAGNRGADACAVNMLIPFA